MTEQKLNPEDFDQDELLKVLECPLRQYAAIHLKVPDSGVEWLDKMILKSKRDEFAKTAMQIMLLFVIVQIVLFMI